MLAMKKQCRLALNDDIMLRAIPEADQFYAFNLENGDHFNLNETAYWVLEKIAPGVMAEELIQSFAQEFELEANRANEDLSEVIAFALENHILKEKEP